MEELLHNWAPVLRIDAAEPFSVIGASVRLESGPKSDHALVYRIAWSADIGHAYDVETIRVTIEEMNSSAGIRAIEGSAHGFWLSLGVPPKDGRIQAFVEPGKHGFGAGPNAFSLPQDVIDWFCGAAAGSDGVYRNPMVVSAGLTQIETLRSCASALRSQAFQPDWSFERKIDLRMVPWLKPKAFDDLVLTSIRSLAITGAPTPLGIPASQCLEDGGYWWGGSLAFQNGRWSLSGTPTDEIFRRARIARTTIIAELPRVDARAIKQLHTDAWPHFLTSRLFLICESELAPKVIAAGLIPVPLLDNDGGLPDSESWRDSVAWVCSRNSAQTRAFSGTALVIGPGEADIVLEI
jgi:hypothetical protein